MALPADFSKIFGSTATGGLTPIGDVNYAKGWEFVGSNPPTKNDFSYLQNLSDLKSQWLYSNKLQRTDPFGDIKSDGTVQTALSNLGLGDGTGRLLGVKTFGSSGTYKKSPGVKKIIVEAVGGGGASGNLSATASNNCGVSPAGSPGAYGKAFYYQDIPESVPVTIGSGGVGGAGPYGSGGDGGQTSFGSLLVCPGGKGSQQRQQVPPFSGGSASEASPPTGSGILFHSVSRSNLCGTLGLGDDQAIGIESTITTNLGVYGKGGTGKYNPASSGPSRGNDGYPGYIIVWEYQ